MSYNHNAKYMHFQLFEKIGNKNANKFWCKELQDCDGINSDSSVQTKTKHIHKKYTQKAFCDHQYFADSAKDLNGVKGHTFLLSHYLS